MPVKKTNTAKKTSNKISKTSKKVKTSVATKAVKSTTKKATEVKKKATTKRSKSKDLTKHFNVSEYYDLPAKYEQTVVKILLQTPNTLFVYWDISEEDRNRYKLLYGDSFFESTKPVLIITNKTMHYTFEVDINDFANSWYLHVNDAKCEYNIELGRRPIKNDIKIPNNFVHISSSNVIEMPNDHILFEKKQNMIYFKNVKTNRVSSKPVINFTLLKNMGRFYNIHEFYEGAYKEDYSTANKLLGNSSSISK